MINRQIIILRKFQELLKAVSGIKYCGFYNNQKDFAQAMGKNKPSILIQDSDEITVDDEPCKLEKVIKTIPIWLYHDVNQEEIVTLTDYENAILDVLYDDTVLVALASSAGVICIIWEGTEKGEYLDVFDYRSPGFKDNLICRKLNFSVIYRNVR